MRDAFTTVRETLAQDPADRPAHPRQACDLHRFPGLVASVLRRYGLSAVPVSSELARRPEWRRTRRVLIWLGRGAVLLPSDVVDPGGGRERVPVLGA